MKKHETPREPCKITTPHEHEAQIEGIWMTDRTPQMIASCAYLREAVKA